MRPELLSALLGGRVGTRVSPLPREVTLYFYGSAMEEREWSPPSQKIHAHLHKTTPFGGRLATAMGLVFFPRV